MVKFYKEVFRIKIIIFEQGFLIKEKFFDAKIINLLWKIFWKISKISKNGVGFYNFLLIICYYECYKRN
jgi:hypothetical protein